MMETKTSDPDNINHIVRGIQFPNTKMFIRKNIEDAMDHTPNDGDVLITSYPKTGTTWMQYIVMQVVSKATLFPNLEDAIFKLNPYLEIVGVTTVDALAEPRIYKHHLPYDMVQKNEKSKVIYTYRHPEDTLMSYYHFSKGLYADYTFELDQFYDNFLTGDINIGSYFKHVLSYGRCHDSNLLMVSYEKLHANRRDEIMRIAGFLGQEHYTCLIENEDILDKIMEHTSFEYMKKNLTYAIPLEKTDGETASKVNFFRKGVIGDGKNALTEDQRGCMQKAAETVLKGTSIVQEWYPDEI